MNPSTTILCLISLTLLSALHLSGRIIDDWQYQHPLPHNQTLWKVDYGEGVYVMVGVGGVLTTSTNLSDWDSEFYPELVGLDGLLYANGEFLVTSRSGKILTSPDGVIWTKRDTGTGKGLLSASFGNGRTVLVGEDGTTATSLDGQNWTISDTGDDNWYFGVAYGNGVFVAASYDIDLVDNGSIATSSDGESWNLVTLPSAFPTYTDFYDVTFAEGKFVATGYFYDETTEFWGVFIATSPDGVNWTRSTNGVPQTNVSDSTPVYLNMVRYDQDNAVWLGVGDRSVLMTSTDAVNWTPTFPLGNSTTDFYGIGFSPEGRVMVGSRANVYFSEAGTTIWEQKFTGNYVTISDIEFNGDLYVATGSTIMTSTDGLQWQTQLGGQPGGTLANVVFGQGRWVAASRNNTSQIPLTTSIDGANWAFTPTLPEGFTDCQDIAFGNGIFVALPQSGTSSVITSTDGLTWTGRNHPWFDGKMSRVYITYDNGIFIAHNVPVSTLQIATSTNGIDWTITDTGLTGSYFDAAYGDGRWVMVGEDGMVATSTNMADWSEQVIRFGIDDPVRLESVAFGKGHWVICGGSKSIWSSEDGLNWDPAFKTGQDGSTNVFNSVIFDGLSFWTVGNFGDILKTGPVFYPVTLSIYPSLIAGNVLLQIEGTPGDNWDILTTPDLSGNSWSIMTTIRLDAETSSLEVPVTGNGFYILAPAR
ncbi:hypothetical protein G0Q06_10415 [Puniceicoccales bacterium CK1056]|uniref:Photosynthesis system II assembly factor Ycf48/Hcf136-like domain-containing protein n=1 Tax=Oceanipulchritudo coccoides TaxID=2706888 RepID=A0A6B2M434_9BACT|nr:hypothetical protein [Oceanipulchritudo coccoides]NDV62864.1 hypothetical protein [Oceanipulchritudo coccoides]